MQKTRLGISVGLAGALLYFLGYFGGYLAAVILAGYVLLVEEDAWLRRTAVKAVGTMLLFSFITSLIGGLCGILNILTEILSWADISIFGVISNINSSFYNVIAVLKFIVFTLLGLKSLGQKSIPVPVVDGLINKYMA